MLPSLPLADSERLKKLLLMLSSDMRASGRLLGQLLRRRGLDFHDLANASTASGTAATGVPNHPTTEVKQTQDGRYRIAAASLLNAVAAIRDDAPLDGDQPQFLESMENRAWSFAVVVLSANQLGFLTRLLQEV